MENSIKFTVAVDKLNRMISELNIKLSKDPENEEFKVKLQEVLADKDRLYKGNLSDVDSILNKYGVKN